MFGHLIIVCFSAYLVFLDGLTSLGNLFSQEWHLVDLRRAELMFACILLYWFRHLLTLFYLLQRRVDWPEVLGLLGFFACFEIGLLLLGGGAFRETVIEFGSLDLIAVLLLCLGSCLNSFSEMQRKWWKRHPENKGQCYTGGLFRHSMHINYFGDIVLFTAWCLFTYNFWSLALPLLIAYTFIKFHIPDLDTYLSQRYGKPFDNYAANTKKLIPYVY